MTLIAFKLSTSLAMTFFLYGANILFFYITFLAVGSIFSLWIATLRSNPSMSVVNQANSSLFSLKNLVICMTFVSINSAPAKVILFNPFNCTLNCSLYGYVLFSFCLSHSLEVSKIINSGSFFIPSTIIMHPLLTFA